ncbi:hypothetical protein B7494_g3826 [Chlorociboria aeruginascens]|nr:hypothetical protein B7494_g3826 [Chlorociboria aeruginascens]
MFSSSATLLAGLVAISTAAKTSRTFAVNHFYGTGPLVTARMDPVVSPGVASQHQHAIMGGSNFALTMSDTTLLSSNCTTSIVDADKSNYWTPSLWFQDPTTKLLEPVPMFYMNVYYFFEPTTDTIEAFPPGLRMVVGDPNLRTPPKGGAANVLDLAQGTPQPIQWTCPRLSSDSAPLYPTDSTGLDGVGIQDPNNAGAGSGFPNQNCDQYASPLRADIHFPSCYNPAAGLDNYKTNMQFPTNNNCPEGWIHTPHIFYEVYWNTPLFASRWTPGGNSQPFVLSNGDPTGYSLHADFIAGWDTTVLQKIIQNCDAGDSGMDKCADAGTLNPTSGSCTIEPAIVDPLSSTMSILPGDLTVGVWGTNVVAATGGGGGGGSSVAGVTASGSGTGTAVGVATPTATGAVVSSSSASYGAATSPMVPAGSISTPAASIPSASPTNGKAGGGGGGGSGMVTSYASITVQYSTTTTILVTASGAAGSSLAPSAAPPAGWTYAGCFADSVNARVITGQELVSIGNHQVSASDCAAHCQSSGFTVAGVEYGGQCFCGDTLPTQSLDASACGMPCEGDKTQMCGGSNAIGVWTASKSSSRVRRRSLRA